MKEPRNSACPQKLRRICHIPEYESKAMIMARKPPATSRNILRRLNETGAGNRARNPKPPNWNPVSQLPPMHPLENKKPLAMSWRNRRAEGAKSEGAAGEQKLPREGRRKELPTATKPQIARHSYTPTTIVMKLIIYRIGMFHRGPN